MAKKNYQKVKCLDNVTITAKCSEKASVMVLTGANSRGTPVKIEININDYFFAPIAKRMKEILKQRQIDANRSFEELKSAIND